MRFDDPAGFDRRAAKNLILGHAFFIFVLVLFVKQVGRSIAAHPQIKMAYWIGERHKDREYGIMSIDCAD
jgi:hypothetical protein